MENEMNQPSGEAVDSVSETTPQANTQASDQPGNPTETSEDQDTSKDDGVYTSPDGKRYISEATFEARLGKEVAKRKGYEEFMDTLKSDPQARQEFLNSLGIEPPKQENKAPSKWDTFVEQSVEASHRPLYRQMKEALLEAVASELLDPKIQAATNPMLSYIGNQEISRLSGQYPDFKKHSKAVTNLVETYGIPADMAYKIVAFDDNFSRGQNSVKKSPNRPSPTPGFGKPSQGAGSDATNQKRSLRDSMEFHAKRLGANE